MKNHWLVLTFLSILSGVFLLGVFILGLWVTYGLWFGYLALGFSLLLFALIVRWLWKKVSASLRKFFIILPINICLLLIFWAMIPLPQYDFSWDRENTMYEFWEVSEGRQVTVGRLSPPKEINHRNLTIVFVHGGPGAYVRGIDIDFLANFAKDGFDVLFYDQVGAGRSSMVDMFEYSHQGNVEDLKHVLEKIEGPVILFGQSYGTGLITSFMADYGDLFDVRQLIFSEPSPLPGVDLDSEEHYFVTKTTKAPSPEEPSLFEVIRSPRMILAMLLPADNGFVPQVEIQRSIGPELQNKIMRTSYCSDQAEEVLPFEHLPVNMLAMMQIRESFSKANRPDLRALEVPVLLLLGECSYIPRGFAMEYFEHFSITRSHWIAGVGHVLWTSKKGSNLTHDAIISFLEEKESPFPNQPTYQTRMEFIEQGL